jgi:decaprenylphospho-beta-D-ribofuranose 2-oxidase
MVEQVAISGLASPLAVLKRLGPKREGYMSFPMEGYTLAVDFPNTARVATVVARLEEKTAEAGGRIYLAKDSLSGPQSVRAMYPEHESWLKAVEKADPDQAYATDLIRRLKLRDAS